MDQKYFGINPGGGSTQHEAGGHNGTADGCGATCDTAGSEKSSLWPQQGAGGPATSSQDVGYCHVPMAGAIRTPT